VAESRKADPAQAGYVSFFLPVELAARVVHLAGIPAQPNEPRTLGIGTILADASRGLSGAPGVVPFPVHRTAGRNWADGRRRSGLSSKWRRER